MWLADVLDWTAAETIATIAACGFATTPAESLDLLRHWVAADEVTVEEVGDALGLARQAFKASGAAHHAMAIVVLSTVAP